MKKIKFLTLLILALSCYSIAKAQTLITNVGTTLICSGRMKMEGDSLPKHTRSVNIPINALFVGNPTVSATIWAENNPGTMFVINTIKFNVSGEQTFIDVEASNVQIAKKSSLKYYCDYIVIGTKK